jgi:hypothetical protein
MSNIFSKSALYAAFASGLFLSNSASAGPYDGHHHRHSGVTVNFSNGYYPAPYMPRYYTRPHHYYRPHFVHMPMMPYYAPRHYSSTYYFQSALMTPDAYDAFEYATPGSRVILKHSMNNGAYSLTPGRVISTEGRYCREYQAKVMVNSRLQNGYGQACRQPDGSWEIIS